MLEHLKKLAAHLESLDSRSKDAAAIRWAVAEIERLRSKAEAWDGACELMRDSRYSSEAGGIYIRNHLNSQL